MERNFTPLVDEHLQHMQGMQEVGTDDFFYTRLMARMESEKPDKSWNLPLKPVWVVGSLALLLAMNGFMLVQQSKTKRTNVVVSTSSLQNFAESYDQSISSSY
jgi:hypothetical protein